MRMNIMVFDAWRKHASKSEFDDLQEHTDRQLRRLMLAAFKARDEHRVSAVWAVLKNRKGLERDRDL